MKRSIAILVAIVLGLLLPAAHPLSVIIRYNLMVMLFFAFLGIRLGRGLFQWLHLKVLLGNLLLPLLLFWGIGWIQREVALAVFVIAAAPTAAAAPVIAKFLHREVSFVTTSVLVTSPAVAVFLPFILPLVAGQQAEISMREVAGPTLSLIFIPLFLSLGLRRLSPEVAAKAMRFSGISFILFLANVFIAAAGASNYLIRHGAEAGYSVPAIGLASGLLCIALFRGGEWMGRHREPIEVGLAVGRKNTMFGIWLALTFLTPLAALGPIFYILFQNIYNSWQLYQLGKIEADI